jgi:hypothetical protein
VLKLHLNFKTLELLELLEDELLELLEDELLEEGLFEDELLDGQLTPVQFEL